MALQQAQLLANQILGVQTNPQPAAAPPPPPQVYQQQWVPNVPPVQAAQPSGPPLHPLFRASFAVEEVSKEINSMMRNQQDIMLDNLLRAIPLAQALLNDLIEAHSVLLNPESHPQYYPPGPFT